MFDNYVEVGGWRGYAQRAAKDAFVTEARSWLEPLEKMLDAEHGRLLALENATADDFLLFVAIRRDLSKLKHYLKISTGNLECHLTQAARSPENQDQENSSRSSANVVHSEDFAQRLELKAYLI